MSVVLFSCFINGYYCQIYQDKDSTKYIMRLSLEGKTVLKRTYSTMKAAKQGIKYYTET